MTDIFDPLKLPSGLTLPNRLAKAAMEENMAEYGQVPGRALHNLYRQWAAGSPGLIITGNVMVAPDAMTGPGGVYLGKKTLDDPDVRQRFEDWAAAGKSGGSVLFMQISHPGRQVYKSMGTQPVSASATKVNLPGPAGAMFAESRAMTDREIKGMIDRYANAAAAAERAGFDGAQIHGAHGYLINQFLSPLTNLREDDWGGSLENRARFLLETVRAVKDRTGKGFGVAVKLNSADFQRGGFDQNDARQVVEWLNKEGLDFVELSGGSYESAAMMGAADEGRVSSTAAREMYFLEFARDIAKAATMPIMVTGGVTRKDTAAAALADGQVDIIGIARAFGYNANIPADWQAGQNVQVALPEITLKNPALKGLATMGMTKLNLFRMGEGKPPKPKYNAWLTIIRSQLKQKMQTKRYQKWLSEQGGGW